MAADLRRLASDLDHVRALGLVGRRMRESLQLAACELRAQAERQDLETLQAEVARLRSENETLRWRPEGGDQPTT